MCDHIAVGADGESRRLAAHYHSAYRVVAPACAHDVGLDPEDLAWRILYTAHTAIRRGTANNYHPRFLRSILRKHLVDRYRRGFTRRGGKDGRWWEPHPTTLSLETLVDDVDGA